MLTSFNKSFEMAASNTGLNTFVNRSFDDICNVVNKDCVGPRNVLFRAPGLRKSSVNGEKDKETLICACFNQVYKMCYLDYFQLLLGKLQKHLLLMTFI